MRFFLILLIPLVFSSSVITIERTWDIDPLSELNGALVLNNSHQKVLFVDSNANISSLGEKVMINSQGKHSVWARANVLVNYDVKFQEDPPLPAGSPELTGMTTYDDLIRDKARNLSTDSTFSTIKNVLLFVHNNIEYDESYWDKNRTAIETFAEKKGVCVQYTHLFISMMNSLGFETRYVVGYVYLDDWQPHTWAEVKLPSGWLPADPTLGQLGNLESNHIGINFGKDQMTTYDSILTQNPGGNFSSMDSLLMTRDPPAKTGFVSMNYSNYTVTVKLQNPGSSYLFANFAFESPFKSEDTIIVMKPNSTSYRYYGLNRSVKDTIPITVRLNDEVLERRIVVTEQQSTCIGMFILVLLALKNAFIQ